MFIFFLRHRVPPRSTRTDTLFPTTTRFRTGPALSADALNKAIDAGVRDLMAKEKLRPALQPAVTLGEGYETGKDAEVTVALEVLPEIATPSLDGLKPERLTVPADDKRTEERRVGQACVSTCRLRGSPLY